MLTSVLLRYLINLETVTMMAEGLTRFSAIWMTAEVRKRLLTCTTRPYSCRLTELVSEELT